MANEIVVDSVRGRQVVLIFIFDLTALGITKAGLDQLAGVYAPTPSAQLPAHVLSQLNATDAAIATGLDTGDKVSERIPFTAPEGMTTPQILATAQAKYATRAAAFVTEYAAASQFHQHVGRVLNAS